MATEEMVTTNVTITVQKTVKADRVFMIRGAGGAVVTAIIASLEAPFGDEGRNDARIIVEWLGDYLPAYTFDEVVRLLRAVKVP